VNLVEKGARSCGPLALVDQALDGFARGLEQWRAPLSNMKLIITFDILPASRTGDQAEPSQLRKINFP
jgi:hypothetical protein